MQTFVQKLEIVREILVAKDTHFEYQESSGSWHRASLATIVDWLQAPNDIRRIDPYAKLKTAHAEGKVIEVFVKADEYGPDRWSKKENAGWPLPPERYRIKPEEPWTLSRHLPGFRPLADGEEWHRQDFTREMLPDGYRPLLLEERRESGRDQIIYSSGKREMVNGMHGVPAVSDDHLNTGIHTITQRPLPPIYKTVKLGPEDVPPGSAIRSQCQEIGWLGVVNACHNGVTVAPETETLRFISFDVLYESGQINRSLSLGKWDANAWEPCRKEVEV